MAISMLKIRRPLGRLIFNMGIAIPGKTVFLIETAPSFLLIIIIICITVTIDLLHICAAVVVYLLYICANAIANTEGNAVIQFWYDHWE